MVAEFGIICILKIDLIGEKCMKMTDREYAMWDRMETMRALALKELGMEIVVLKNKITALEYHDEPITIEYAICLLENLTRLRSEFQDVNN